MESKHHKVPGKARTLSILPPKGLIGIVMATLQYQSQWSVLVILTAHSKFNQRTLQWNWLKRRICNENSWLPEINLVTVFVWFLRHFFLFSVFKIFTPAINLVTLQKVRREQREQQEKELLEKRQQFKEATKNLLVFAPEEQAPKEKPPRGRKVTSGLFSLKFLYWPLQMSCSLLRSRCLGSSRNALKRCVTSPNNGCEGD